MKKWQTIVLCLALNLLFVLAACAPQPSPTTPPTRVATPVAPTSAIPQPVAIPAPWGDWDKVVGAAKKEGRVIVYTTQPPALRVAWSKAFKAAFGITAEFISGAPDSLAEKIMTEQRAKAHASDIFEVGVFTMEPLRKAGYLSPLQVPEAMKTVWRADPWGYDPNVFMHDMYSVPFAVNTNLVKPADEPKSWSDLLEPRWKGKMIMFNPARSGAGGKAFTSAKNWVGGMDYWRKMATQEITFTNDYRDQIDRVIRGEFLLAIGIMHAMVPALAEVGAPIKWVMPKEGTGAKEGGIVILRNAPHPNAAKVFVNWVLSVEGMTILSTVIKVPVSRADVPDGHLPPESRWGPELKLRVLTPQERAARDEDLALAAEVFGIKR